MFVLRLNRMAGKSEYSDPAARAETREDLEAFLQREQVEPYYDGHWHKTFRAGGPLEWFNPPEWNTERCGIFDMGTREQFLEKSSRLAEDHWAQFCSEVPDVS